MKKLCGMIYTVHLLKGTVERRLRTDCRKKYFPVFQKS